MSKHTPGPWTFGLHELDEELRQFRVTEKPFDYRGPGFYDNPSIYGANGEEIVGCDEYYAFSGPADARLIAAAPELLEALRALVHYAAENSAGVLSCYEEYQADEIKNARAAIAKAEGTDNA
jgi:hypothetical protein